jgi:2-oxoglutarate dehydrogenase E2 component (dihydrolipoamide succinyltransferase)
VEELRRLRSSPLVRNMVKEHGLDLSRIPGTGISGRVTKNDVERFLESGGASAAPGRTGAPGAATRMGDLPPAYLPGDRVEVVPMTVMRKKIAEHMVLSRHTSAHVTTFFEVDMTQVFAARENRKAEFEAAGTKLTITPIIMKAVVDALKAFPILNASVMGESIVYKKDVNIGIAVALDWGLIVPVVRRADEKNLLGLARAVNDLAERARAKKLLPDEVSGGTFTITNPGIYGGIAGTPIINQPQVAILGLGGIKKRAVVIGDDAIGIRPMAMLALSFDHRIIDGAVADQFMAMIQKTLEDPKFAEIR